jgi:beta-glucosidase
VLAGGGSSQGIPPGGVAVKVPLGGDGMLSAVRTEAWFPSSPLHELQAALPNTSFRFDPGLYPADAAEIARRCDIAVVFVSKLESEGYDSPDLNLPLGQDALIDAVAAANPNTVVVLETGNPTSMPWRHQVRAVLQAWYPGQSGGRAIAEVLTGAVNPSGRLPITFPASTDDLPRPHLAGFGDPFGTPHSIEYHEGAEVGYRWFAAQGIRPMYPFGSGRSYTTFDYEDLDVHDVQAGDTLVASVTVTNTGACAGADVVQVYLELAAGETRRRLLGFERVELDAGESRRVTIAADARLAARYDLEAGQWFLAGGDYAVFVGTDAETPVLRGAATVTERHFGR